MATVEPAVPAAPSVVEIVHQLFWALRVASRWEVARQVTSASVATTTTWPVVLLLEVGVMVLSEVRHVAVALPNLVRGSLALVGITRGLTAPVVVVAARHFSTHVVDVNRR